MCANVRASVSLCVSRVFSLALFSALSYSDLFGFILFFLFSSHCYFRCLFYSNERENEGSVLLIGSIREELVEQKP